MCTPVTVCRLQSAILVQMPDALLEKAVECVERQQLFTETLEQWRSMLSQAEVAAIGAAHQARETCGAADNHQLRVDSGQPCRSVLYCLYAFLTQLDYVNSCDNNCC